MRSPIREEYCFRIEENENYPPGEGPALLFIRFLTRGEFRDTCVGSTDQSAEMEWEVLINQPYDEETDSDARVVGKYGTREEAINALWEARHQAYIW